MKNSKFPLKLRNSENFPANYSFNDIFYENKNEKNLFYKNAELFVCIRIGEAIFFSRQYLWSRVVFAAELHSGFILLSQIAPVKTFKLVFQSEHDVTIRNAFGSSFIQCFIVPHIKTTLLSLLVVLLTNWKSASWWSADATHLAASVADNFAVDSA